MCFLSVLVFIAYAAAYVSVVALCNDLFALRCGREGFIFVSDVLDKGSSEKYPTSRRVLFAAAFISINVQLEFIVRESRISFLTPPNIIQDAQRGESPPPPYSPCFSFFFLLLRRSHTFLLGQTSSHHSTSLVPARDSSPMLSKLTSCTVANNLPIRDSSWEQVVDGGLKKGPRKVTLDTK